MQEKQGDKNCKKKNLSIKLKCVLLHICQFRPCSKYGYCMHNEFKSLSTVLELCFDRASPSFDIFNSARPYPCIEYFLN